MNLEQAIDFWRSRVKEDGFQKEEFFAWANQNEDLAKRMGDKLVADLPPLFEPLINMIKGLFK